MMPSTMYGSLMHHCAELDALSDAAHQSPYNAPPKAPVLYIKPANTHLAFGKSFSMPAQHLQIVARACVGLIYKPNSPLASVNTAQGAIKNIVIQDWHVALYCDFTLPHSSFYRPPLCFNALDGSLALPQNALPFSALDLSNLHIETWINGTRAHRYASSDWLASAQEQLREVSEFIAWETSDVLMLGCPPDAPLVKAGDVVETRMNGQIFTRTLMTQEAS